ncbi:MAG TPA: serine--tRNA ligase, partial [Polyangia bacterium]
MLDINALRTDLGGVAAALEKRGVALDGARFESLEAERKRIQTLTQELQAKRNTLSRQVGIAKGRGEDTEPLLRDVSGLGDELKGLERELDNVQAKLRDFLLGLPNVTDPSTPAGRSADDNVEVR